MNPIVADLIKAIAVALGTELIRGRRRKTRGKRRRRRRKVLR